MFDFSWGLPLVANAGTPLMWSGCCLLLVGNFLLGIVEAKLLARFTHRPCKPGPLVWANYCSMLAGVAVVLATGPVKDIAARDPFRLGWITYISLLFLCWCVTVLIEWPFVAKCAGLPNDRTALALSLKVQSITCFALAVLSLMVGATSALRDLRAVDQIPTVPGWGYYQGIDGQTIFRVRLDGSRREVVAISSPSASQSRVFLEPIQGEDRTRLVLVSFEPNSSYPQVKEISPSVGRAGQSAPYRLRPNEDPGYRFSMDFYRIASRSFVEAPRVSTGYWAVIGLGAYGKYYALETPFLTFSWRNAVVLPDGKIFATFGKAIVLVDAESGTVTKLGEGSAGDVLLDHPMEAPPSDEVHQ